MLNHLNHLILVQSNYGHTSANRQIVKKQEKPEILNPSCSALLEMRP